MGTTKVRARDKDSLAVFLGWFSIGLGLAETSMPRLMCKVVGASGEGRSKDVMRVMGAREIAQGLGILTRPRPTGWLAARVAGDVVDLAALLTVAAVNRRRRTAFAIANVLAVAIPDVYETRHLAQKSGAPARGKLIRKSVTINRPRLDVEQAWTAAPEVRNRVDKRGASVSFQEAPGDRGTELTVEFMYAPPGGDLGSAVQKLLGRDLATQLSDDLRLLKQEIEAGQIVRSEAVLDGHLLAQHLRQRAAQPVAEAVR